MNLRTWNKQALLELVCYLLFAFAVFYLVISGDYLRYVTPRMKPYLLFTSVVLVFWARTALEDVPVQRHRFHSMHCLLLVLPMLLLLAPRAPITVSSVNSSALRPTVSASAPAAAASSSEAVSASDSAVVSDTTLPAVSYTPPEEPTATGDEYNMHDFMGNYVTTLHGYDAANHSITIADEELYAWLDALWTDPASFEGWTITTTGQVDRSSQPFADDEFMPARLAMTCCAADLVPCGIVCKWDKTSTLTADSWVTVTGTVYLYTYSGTDVEYTEPRLNVTSVTQAQPLDGYLYPYY